MAPFRSLSHLELYSLSPPTRRLNFFFCFFIYIGIYRRGTEMSARESRERTRPRREQNRSVRTPFYRLGEFPRRYRGPNFCSICRLLLLLPIRVGVCARAREKVSHSLCNSRGYIVYTAEAFLRRRKTYNAGNWFAPFLRDPPTRCRRRG